MERGVGRFNVEFELVNYQDVVAARLGVIGPDKVRRTHLSGLVDTGATRLVLPEAAVRQLGLPPTGETAVRYADGRRAKRKTAGDAEVEIQGRSGVFSAVVGPRRTEALIGAIVLEELDFVLDCTNQRLVPRDPHGTVTEIE
jgi:clan AA aspartic protease